MVLERPCHTSGAVLYDVQDMSKVEKEKYHLWTSSTLKYCTFKTVQYGERRLDWSI